MTAVLERPPLQAGPGAAADGGMPARRAMLRWAWRLFRREWRQQLLVLALVIVAVAATVIGSTVATTDPAPTDAGYGTAQFAARYAGADPQLATQLSALRQRFGAVDVIENRLEPEPGSVGTFDLRAQNPSGPYGGPMLSLLSGQYPAGPGQVAVTPGVAADFHLHLTSTLTVAGRSRRVVGTVQDPQSLLDEFALVVPGQVTTPTQVTVLFDSHGRSTRPFGRSVSAAGSDVPANLLNPQTISLAVLVIGMLLIALVSIGGFTVLAQRRLRSLGLLASLGATGRNVRLVVRANGVAVGVVGAVLGFVLGLGGWLAYRPHLESSSHHVIGVWALPWTVVGLAVVLAVVATFVGASRPARAVVGIPVVTALSGRPAPPRQLRRSAVPGLACLGVSFLLMGVAGGASNGGGQPELVFGLVALIPAVILLAPFCLSVLARVGRHAPVSIRLALRDLSRYRARSGSALAAISIGVLIAVIIAVVAAARYGNVVDYAGPNLTSDQLVLHLTRSTTGPQSTVTQLTITQLTVTQLTVTPATAARTIARALGATHVIALKSPSASLQHEGAGRSFSGTVFVATPQLLSAYGINPSEIDPAADVLSSRPGFAGVSGLTLQFGGSGPAKATLVTPTTPRPAGGGPRESSSDCSRAHGCLPDPVIQEVSQLPTGTSAPNTVLTEHALRTFDISDSTAGWLLQTSSPLSATQIATATSIAAHDGLAIEVKNDEPTSSQVIDWATVFGILLALCILAMSVGLIRSETAGDLRTLSATGASGGTRRRITAATAGALGFVGALPGTVAAYVGVAGYLRANSQTTGFGALANVPITNLAVILVGMPLLAASVAWLLAGRQPSALSRGPID